MHFQKTKIIATIGPACDTKEKLLQLFMEGVDVFRINFSHGTHEKHLKVIQYIKEINNTHGTCISILQDLQGPKIRISEIENGSINLEAGSTLTISPKPFVGNIKKISTSYTDIVNNVKIGDIILIDDGKIELNVKEIKNNEVITKVLHGGILKSRKGMNLPNTDISISSLTNKDKEDMQLGIAQNIDWIAISFVRYASDVVNLKQIIIEKGEKAKNIKIIAKIERPEAIGNIDRIITEADGLMIARGDLGLEMEMSDIPIIQKNLVKKCNIAGKPVIIATQMMESMTENPRPTRAEVNDVANAVMDGADAVMLSGETASGAFPIQTVHQMSKIINSIEHKFPSIYNKYYEVDLNKEHFISDTVIQTAIEMAKSTKAKAIIAMTYSGSTAFRLAKHRPQADIFIFTANKSLLTTLNLLWGVRTYYYNKDESTDHTFADVEEILVKENFLSEGNVFINIASMPLRKRGRTNTVKLGICGSK